MLSLFIFLACILFSNGLNLRENNICEIRLFNEPEFRGDSIGVTKVRERFMNGGTIRHSYEKSIGFSDVESLHVFGRCCWEIHR